jgi:glycosyltransferase involved in cell wall biosynthesis
MQVSAIITAYNYGKYIERAIRSLIHQNFPKDRYEIIVVNDASTDSTKEILENYKDEVRVINLEKNVGLAEARNIGIKKAKGQFVVFIDADDYVHTDMLYVQSLFLTENNDLDAVAVDYYLVDDKERHIELVSAKEKPIACGIMFRKERLIDIGMYDKSFKAREDEDLRIRFMKKYDIYNIILPLYRYRRHDNNLTNNKEKMDKYYLHLKNKHQ